MCFYKPTKQAIPVCSLQNLCSITQNYRRKY